MSTGAKNSQPICCQRMVLRGCVQGHGVRPAIARLARQRRLSGFVRNTGAGVEIVVQGPPDELRGFWTAVFDLPTTELGEVEDEPNARDVLPGEFRVLHSVGQGPLATRVPPDVVTCPACLAEVMDVDNRRHGYALTSCTVCGPRYSIITQMPYDRERTSMQVFALCDSCQREYDAQDGRRSHAQTNACADCGPQLVFRPSGTERADKSATAIAAAARTLLAGQTLALRGIGGYQLLCDATSAAAVARLREQKQRPAKPLAVMVGSVAEAERLVTLTPAVRQALTGPAGPIVIAQRREAGELAADIAPGLDCLGVMLPSSALHELISQAVGRPLVVTSGNVEGQPLAFREHETASLFALADAVLDHDRPIVRPIDDSVVHEITGRLATVRLGRGLAPLAIDVEITRPLAALGGHQKGAIALANGSQAVLGPHLGDLDELETRRRCGEQYRALVELYGAEPAAIAHDLHPDYFTTSYAKELAAAGSLPTVAVQHHHAHVVAGMVEHGWLDRLVLGVAWDGTGYGADGGVWGGEFLLTTARRFRRAAHLQPFPLPGGERAIRQPWRVAVSLVALAAGPAAACRLQFPGVTVEQIEQVVQLATRPAMCPVTTSVGRLFDGVAALLLDQPTADYEGQLAERLEAAANPQEAGSYEIPWTGGVLDWRRLIVQVLHMRQQQADVGQAAMRFHRGLAQAIVDVCGGYAEYPVVLGGGVFQNRRLVQAIVDQWSGPQPLGLPGAIPVGDGGLAVGQLVAVAAQLGRLRYAGESANEFPKAASCV